MTRRLFQNLSLVLFPIVYAGGAVAMALRYLLPLAGPKRQASKAAGEAAEIELGKVVEINFNGRKVWVLHDGKAFRAFDAKCTHLGCFVEWSAAHRDFDCRCHGAKFSKDGRATRRPAVKALGELEVADVAQNGGKVVVLDRVKTG